MTGRPEWLGEWFGHIAEQSALSVEEIELGASSQWMLEGGAIRHRSGRFFTVTGIEWTAPGGAPLSQPLLLQKGSGTLGFLMAPGSSGNSLLVYAKVEPGNVDDVQLAPTCQATESNLERIHGGAFPPFADLFGGAVRPVYDVLQSEQGTRFLAKQNRNVLVCADIRPALPDTHRWLPVEEVLDLSDVTFSLNSDARSVLVCSPWRTLVGRAPFSRYRDGLGAELAGSAGADAPGPWLEELSAELNRLRSGVEAPVRVPLGDLAGWRLNDSGVEPESGTPFRVIQIQVEANGREVATWDQPIIRSAGRGLVELACGRVGGVLHFLLRPFAEPGLANRAQLGPTSVSEPGGLPDDAGLDTGRATVMAECLHSEEGSRFFRDVNHFRVIDVGEAFEPPDSWHWLTLNQIRRLLDESGWLTIEARGALSLLLKWL